MRVSGQCPSSFCFSLNKFLGPESSWKWVLLLNLFSSWESCTLNKDLILVFHWPVSKAVQDLLIFSSHTLTAACLLPSVPCLLARV